MIVTGMDQVIIPDDIIERLATDESITCEVSPLKESEPGFTVSNFLEGLEIPNNAKVVEPLTKKPKKGQ